MTQDEILEPIVKAVRQGTSLSGPEIRRFFQDWEAIPVQVNGRHVGTAVMKGTEIHFALVPSWRPRSCQRGAIRAFLKPLFDRHGFLTTRVAHERPVQKKFVQRVGFKPTWRDEQVEYFLLGKMPYERNP